jgi:hypothetical protein
MARQSRALALLRDWLVAQASAITYMKGRDTGDEGVESER